MPGMRAAVVERMGELPAVGELPAPQPADDLVLVEVAYSTLNPMEVRLAVGMVGGPPEVPYAPGVEGVGRAMEGPHEGELVRFECALPGHGSNGALAEFALAEPESIHSLPTDAPQDLAAALGVVGVTAALALDAAGSVEGARVAVLGASGSVGKQAVQLARNRGAARVVAAARDRDALERARELGADAIVELRDGGTREAIAEALIEAAEGRLDVVIDPLWGVPGVAAASALAHGGRTVNVGHSAGPNEPPPWHELRINAASMIGVSSGWTDLERKRPVYAELLDAALAGELEVDREVVPLADISSAWERQQGSPHTKIVIDVGGGE